MSMSDPLADMLTRLRNATNARFQSVEMPLSKLKLNVAKVLKNEGYIKEFHIIDDNSQGILKLDLKYGDNNENVVSGIKRISKPGHRQYTSSDKIPKVMSGLGIAILTTSKGIITDKEARQQSVGGEILCEIW